MGNRIVVGIGEILWDIFPERKVLGGAPANFAYHISQFGFEGYAVSAVGEDLMGREVLLSLENKGLDHLIEITGYPTGTVQVKLDGRGVPSYTIIEDVAWDHIPFTERMEALAERTVAVCYGTLAQRSPETREAIRRFVAAMPPDSLRILDINLRSNYYSAELIDSSIKMSNILKINDEELIEVSELFNLYGNEQELAATLRRNYDLDILILTKGTSGSYVFAEGCTSLLPTPEVTVADTVGAGDSFTAAFTAAYLKGAGIEEAHLLAVKVSAYVCQNYGAMPDMADIHKEIFR